MGNVAVELEQRAAQAVTTGLASATGSAIAYDVTGPMVVNEIARRRRALIDGAVEAQMQAYRHITPDLQGTTRKERAQRIVRATGLGERDLQWIDSYRQSLEAGSRGAYDRAFHDRRYKPRDTTKRPRTPEEIDRMVEAYSRKMTSRRIKDIADAEALRSFNEGQFLAMEQAERNNDLTVGQRGIRWDSRGDDKVRDSHVQLNGQTRPNGSAFQGIYGAIRFPHDPQADSRETMGCRCRARPVLLT